MATISKFYLLDAASPNTGTLPTGAYIVDASFGISTDSTGDATGARTARDATDVAGTSNPDIQSQFTALANTSQQAWGHRRYVTRPLAGRTFDGADGNWTFSLASSESNLNHNQLLRCIGYGWNTTSGVRVGTSAQYIKFGPFAEPTVAATQQAQTRADLWVTALTISDGDVLVFEVYSIFTQGMATAYTEEFAYNGTTEASTTTCATFITPPAALTLYTPSLVIPEVMMAPMAGY